MIRPTGYHALLLLLLFIGGQGTLLSNPLPRPAEQNDVLQSPQCNKPQWKDMGMEDILATVSYSPYAAPSATRLIQKNLTAMARCTDTPQRQFPSSHTAATSPHRALPGHIYQLLCLRL